MTYNRLPNFPPYGFLPQHFQDFNTAIPVTDFLPGDPDRQKKWEAFFEDTLGIFNQYLWPRWETSLGGWVFGKNVVTLDQMNDLTEADFRVFERMASVDRQRGLQQLPKANRRTLGCLTHEGLFVQEDGRRKTIDQTDFGDGFQSYSRDLDADICLVARKLMEAAMLNKDLGAGASVGIPFKAKLQRPRAYQIALMAGFDAFRNERANTAPSPSMINGHAAQGIVGTCGLVERLLNEGREFDREAAAQFMVDVGDRRVMAGVHYPSDNIASWMLCLRLAKFIFRSHVRELVHLMWQGISKQSIVFAAIEKDIEILQHERRTSAYILPMRELRRIAAGEGAE